MPKATEREDVAHEHKNLVQWPPTISMVGTTALENLVPETSGRCGHKKFKKQGFYDGGYRLFGSQRAQGKEKSEKRTSG